MHDHSFQQDHKSVAAARRPGFLPTLKGATLRLLAVTVAVAIVVVAVSASLLLAQFGAGSGATPFALPSGATGLAIVTEPPAGNGDTCLRGGGMPAFQIERSGSTPVFVVIDTGKPVSLVWPRGFSARLYGGLAELLTPDGTVVGREGVPLDTVGGSYADTSSFHVCDVSIGNYQWPPGRK